MERRNYLINMTQVVSNRTGREKIITAEGENTEFSVQVKKQKIY